MLIQNIENKNVVWFENSNSYLIVEPTVSNILSQLENQTPTAEIQDKLVKELDIPKDIAEAFISDVQDLAENQNKVSVSTKDVQQLPIKERSYFSEKYYEIYNRIFLFQFETEYHELLVHPKISYLEIKTPKEVSHQYQIFDHNEQLFFCKDGQLINSWTTKESHLLQGKLFMHLVIDIYNKPEKDWLGVFHASAISNGEKGMLFLGDSGNGKSTSLALLNANGFSCIADDFVPIDSNKKIRTFPSAISIKKNSVPTLLPIYPELNDAAEFNYTRLRKIVRYLPPKEQDYTLELDCKALIFIKYEKDSDLKVRKISKIQAFQELIPDSWISPLAKNAQQFLDWFLALPCYQLIYSDNDKMVKTVGKIFNDEL